MIISDEIYRHSFTLQNSAIGVGVLALASSVLILGLIPYVESMIKNDWDSDLGVSFSPSNR